MPGMSRSSLHIGPVGFLSGVPMTAAGLLWQAAAPPLVTPAWSTPNILGNISIALRALLFLWGTTINRRHLWQAWWKGPPNPFAIKAWSRNWQYEEGADIGGIRWHKAFAHIRVNLTNIGDATVEDLTALLGTDQPIVKSRARCEFAECRIASAGQPADITVRVKLKDGREVDIAPTEKDQLYFGPPHQLVCDRLPAGATIEINLATAVPNEPGAQHIFKQEHVDPEYIDIALQWHIMDEYIIANGRFTLRNEK